MYNKYSNKCGKMEKDNKDKEKLFEHYMNESKELFDKNRFEDAAERAKAAYELYKESFPKNYAALMRMKDCYKKLGNEKKVRDISELIRKVLEEDTKRRIEAESRKKLKEKLKE